MRLGRNMQMKKGLLFCAVLLGCLAVSCELPEPRAETIYQNTYETVRTLIITSDMRETEGWIEVQEKDVERTYGRKDTLYLVYRKNRMAGFVTADGRAFRCTYDLLPYDPPQGSDRVPVEKYLGTWKTLEMNVQRILGPSYPVSIY
jgi:hypothetical protein